MLMSAAEYRESLNRYMRVFVNRESVARVAADPRLAPGIAAVRITYDFALEPEHGPPMTVRQGTSGKMVNRMLQSDLSKLRI